MSASRSNDVIALAAEALEGRRARALELFRAANSRRLFLLIAGLVISTIGWLAVETYFENQAFMDRAATNYRAGRTAVEDPNLFGTRAKGVFWFGIALIGLSQLAAIEVAVREHRLDDLNRD